MKMGLDITAYKNLKAILNPNLDSYGNPENWHTEWKPGASMDWSESCFPGRGEGVDSDTVYTYEDRFDFRAGSYSGYNQWRAELASFAQGDAFSELINFADNEGVIGPVVSKKLAKDFADNADRDVEYAKTLGYSNGEWWLSKYEAWKKAFEMASENGAVDFH